MATPAEHQKKLNAYYEWRGLEPNKQKKTNGLRANVSHEAKALLRQQGITPSSVKRKAHSLFGGDAKITAADIAVLTRQISHYVICRGPLGQID